MAIVRDRAGKYFNISDDILAKSEVDVLDLPPNAAFGTAISGRDLDKVVAGYDESDSGGGGGDSGGGGGGGGGSAMGIRG